MTTLINLIKGDIFLPNADKMIGLLWNGIFTVAVANSFWILALEKGKTAKISNLEYITPFLSLIWTSVFLGEKITMNSLIDLVVIVAGIFIQMNDKKLN